ncbi:cupin [Burkholderia ambifaria]|uniref:cupin n=1 Tax=Burkholderia ambifaria TaxID=152480 RepID=UPI00158C5D0A|nr:cupin [Burkholderia ambifaria]WDR86133.1 cupin [Burkholderia ambifaria]WDR98765.1 cupin [Burkholderia ambifaria]
MAINKLHDEFHTLDMQRDWRLPEGYDPASGAQELILSGGLDIERKRGSRTRLLRLPAGLHTKKPFVHDYWEEVFLVEGDLTVGNDEHGNGGTPFNGYTYAVRPPGAWHGPFKSNAGCVLLEIHYYDPA